MAYKEHQIKELEPHMNTIIVNTHYGYNGYNVTITDVIITSVN
jgi:hypothetical protein